MAYLYWPKCALPAISPYFDPVYRTTSGGAVGEGLGQISSSDAGFWKATFEKVFVSQRYNPDVVKAWHAIDSLLGGRETPILMPVPVSGRRPLPAGVTDADIDGDAVPHSDDSFFSDDSGYVSEWIEVVLAANAAYRATTLSLTKIACGTIESGMRFSIGPRLYQVKRVVSQSAGAAVVVTNFPLREPALAGAECSFARPVCLMRLATDSEMNLPLERNRRASPTINLVEYL